jgi:hypothetical protein
MSRPPLTEEQVARLREWAIQRGPSFAPIDLYVLALLDERDQLQQENERLRGALAALSAHAQTALVPPPARGDG